MGFALFCGRVCNCDRLSSPGLKQHHQCGQRYDGDKKEKVIADNRPNNRHFSLRRSDEAVLRKLMQTRYQKLCRHKKQNDRRDAKELLQIDSDTTFYERHSK